MSDYMQNQMDNLIQSGISERENMISDLKKWQSTAKELAEALEGLQRQTDEGFVKEDLKNGISHVEWELNLRKAIIVSNTALQTYKTLTDEN